MLNDLRKCFELTILLGSKGFEILSNFVLNIFLIWRWFGVQIVGTIVYKHLFKHIMKSVLNFKISK